MVVDLVLFFSVGTPMGVTEVKATVQSIIQNFWMLKPDDFKMCFEMAKRGDFGKIYNRVDGNVILTWLSEYSELRTQRAIQNNDAEHSRYKAEANNSVFDRNKASEADRDKYAAAMRDYLINQNKKSA